jgi:hypothetical protein
MRWERWRLAGEICVNTPASRWRSRKRRFPALRFVARSAQLIHTMKTLSFAPFAFIAAILFTFPPASHAADNDPPAGFVSLFNGKDFSNWKVPDGDNGHWKIVNGVIDYDAQSEAGADKNLWTEREYTDFVLQIDWRIKEAPYTNFNVPYILPDGTHARDVHGKEIKMAFPDADSGVFLRGSSKHQVNIFCWPIGSGEMYGVRMDKQTPPEVRAAVTPRTQADKPVGEWNRFQITVRGNTVKVELNGRKVIPGALLSDLPATGRIALQHHGAGRPGKWTSPPALVQFKNIYIQELSKVQ